MTIAVDEDVRLCGTIISGSRRKPAVARTGLRSLWTMFAECRYCNPFAASVSLKYISGFKDRGRNENLAHKTKTINLGMGRYKIEDVPVNQPFGDDA
jgi:hypothetical protein